MGFLFSGVCYPDLPTAKQAECTAQSFAWGNNGSTTVYTADCTSTAFDAAQVNMTICRRSNGGACTNSTKPYLSYSSCAWDGGTGMTVDYFGALLAFLAIVLVAKRLTSIFWRNHESI